MKKTNDFLERVLRRVPHNPPTDYSFEKWEFAGKSTQEGFGLLPIAGVDPEALIARVMDVDNYVGHIDHVEESRAIADDRFTPPDQVRFYQRISIPILGSIHQELVLTDAGEIDGYRVAFWELLEPETSALSSKVGARSQYSDGAWLVKPGFVGYALSSAPRRDDVGFLKFKALTKGANVGASTVVRANIEGMSRWAQRVG